MTQRVRGTLVSAQHDRSRMPKRHRHHQRMMFAFNSDARPSSTRLTLMIMCHYAGESGLYRRGHEHLADTLRGAGDATARAKAVQRAIKNLTAAGYIEQVEPPRRGHPPVYRICFDRKEP